MGTKTEASHDYPVEMIPLARIEAKQAFNSRVTSAAKVKEMSESIKVNGLLEPLVVRPTAKGYFLVAGFSRHAACTALKMESVRCSILPSGTTDVEAKLLNYVENAHRKDLSQFEKAKILSGLSEMGIKGPELAKRVGFEMSQSAVDNLVRLFNKLDPKIKAIWGDPESKLTPYLSTPVLLGIVTKGDQNEALLEHLKMNNLIAPDVKSLGGGVKVKAKDAKGREGNKTLLPRGQVEAAFAALEENSEVGPSQLEGAMAVFEFVLRKRAKLVIGSHSVYDPKAAKEAAEKLKAQEKKDKAAKKDAEKQAKKAEKEGTE